VIDQRFSPAAFEAVREDIPALTALQESLEQEMLAVMESEVVEAFRRTVVDKLNDLGHELEIEEGQPDEHGVDFAHGDPHAPSLRLWVSWGWTPTAGYAGVKTPR
jgi:hypothetical protein